MWLSVPMGPSSFADNTGRLDYEAASRIQTRGGARGEDLNGSMTLIVSQAQETFS